MPLHVTTAAMLGLGLMVSSAPEQAVEISGARHGTLVEATREPEVPASVHAASRRVEIVRDKSGRLLLRATWQLAAVRPGWLAAELVRGDVLVRSVTMAGKPAATAATDEAIYIAAWVTGAATLELVAELRGDPTRGPVPIGLLGATRGTAIVRGEPTWRIEATAAASEDDEPATSIHVAGVAHGGGSALQLGVVTPPATDADVVAIGRVGIGLFVGDAEIRGRARLQWVLRRGELASVSFTARGVGEDFTVTGPEVREVIREGERVRVELQSPATGVVALEATWSQKTPPGDAVVTPPSFELADTGRTEASLELGRDGDVDVLPTLDGWRAVAAVQLPVWGRDLIEGASAAAWTRHAPADAGKLQLLRFVPVEAPKVVIGEASFELASADHGMTLVKARYEVLNERASHLRLTLPPQSRLLAVEVSGVDARIAKDGEQILVPISRSLETLQGLVSIPVVVSVLVRQPKWRRREHRELALPTIDAPIRKITASWLLPRDVKATSDVGEHGIASVYDPPRAVRERKRLGTKSKRSRWPAKNAQATAVYDFDDDADGVVSPDGAAISDDFKQSETDRLLREAQESYNRNEFDEAQRSIDELRSRGLEDDDAEKLQSNLDIVNAPTSGPEPSLDTPARPTSANDIQTISGKAGAVRRIREQAKVRGAKKRIENDSRKRKAKELRAKGDYAAAEAEYRTAIEESKKLGNLEQEESHAMDFEAEALEKELESTKSEKAARESIDAQSSTKFAPSFEEGGEHGFGAAWLTTTTALDVPDALVPPAPPKPVPNHGPRVLMPQNGGGRVGYSFDLWAPNSRHSLVVDARRRRHR